MKTFLRNILALLLAVLLLITPVMAAEQCEFILGSATRTAVWDDGYLNGPTTDYRSDLAAFCMDLVSLSPKAEELNPVLKDLGFRILTQVYYDKDPADISHNTAYTIATREIQTNGKAVTLYTIIVEPHTLGEFRSNFDFAARISGDGSTRDYETAEAYPFTESAREILRALRQLTDGTDAVFLVTGHSRGGGVANYLGKLLNDTYGPEQVRVYGFAVPNVVAVTAADREASYYKNIFSINNPEDVVVYVPMETLGFCRVGQTLWLDSAAAARGVASELHRQYTGKPFYAYGDNGTEAEAFVTGTLGAFAPSVRDYYEVKHPAYRDYSSGLVPTPGKVVNLTMHEFTEYILTKMLLLTSVSMDDTGALIDLAGEILALYQELKSIEAERNMAYKPVLQYFLRHVTGHDTIDGFLHSLGLDLSGLGGLLGSIGKLDDLQLDLRELVTVHTVLGVRVCVEALETVSNQYLNEEILAENRVEALSCGDIAMITGEGLYADMTLHAELRNDCYDLFLTSPTTFGGSETERQLPDAVQISLALPEDCSPSCLYRLVNDHGEEIPYIVSDGRAVFDADSLGQFHFEAETCVKGSGLLSFEDGTARVAMYKTGEDAVVITAGYTAQGRMTGVFQEVLSDGAAVVRAYDFSAETETVRVFVLTEDYIPVE